MPDHTVTALVYKYNPHAIWILSVYGICFFWFCFSLPSLGSGEIFVFGGALIALPLYVRYSEKSALKVRTWDERKLVFSSDGIRFGDVFYPLSGLEAAGFYIDTFNGFQYRSRAGTGEANRENWFGTFVSDGDKSTVSFRFKGIVTDFTFCLENYDAFAALRSVITDWGAAGVNVIW